jgi:hypothetical protein
MSFATKLKEIAADLFDAEFPEVHGVLPDRTREILQKLGTEVCRHIDPDVWVKYLVKKIKALPACSRIVVSDCRYINELNGIQELGGICWRTKRNVATDGHISENALDDIPDTYFDTVIDNREWTYEELIQNATEICDLKFSIEYLRRQHL